jgi:hypothetical protein
MKTPGHTPHNAPVALFGGNPAPERVLTVAAHADHRREDFVFARTQSRVMHEARWERRLPPLSRSLLTCVANAAADIVARLA